MSGPGCKYIASIQNIEKADQIIHDSAERHESFPGFHYRRLQQVCPQSMVFWYRLPVLLPVIFIRRLSIRSVTDENVMKLSAGNCNHRYHRNLLWCIPARQYFEINLFAFSGMAIFVVPILFGIYWKKATAKGAIASVIVGIISLLLFTLNPSVEQVLAMGFHCSQLRSLLRIK